MVLIDLLHAFPKTSKQECYDTYNMLLSLLDYLFKRIDTDNKDMNKLFLDDYIYEVKHVKKYHEKYFKKDITYIGIYQ